MAEITNELIYEVLKSIQSRLNNLDSGQTDIKNELVGIRGHMLATVSETNNLYSRLGSVELRLDRIEKRLGMSDVTLS